MGDTTPAMTTVLSLDTLTPLLDKPIAPRHPHGAAHRPPVSLQTQTSEFARSAPSVPLSSVMQERALGGITKEVKEKPFRSRNGY